MIKEELFGTLFVLANRLQVLGDRLDDQISTKQWLLLAVLLQSPESKSTLTQLSLQMGSSRQNVKKMAVILEAKGFLTIEKPEEDKRSVLISPTPACLEHLKTREAKEAIFIDSFYQDFSEEELVLLKKGLEKWMHNLAMMEQQYEEEN
ncbi:MAG: MarR family transcriptional regulator [Spirochaetia bacterium]|nr:MarR family transcriptional regulator [Spirochaetia bacterium]